MIKRLSLLLAAMFVASMMFVAPVFAAGNDDWNNGDADNHGFVDDNNNKDDHDDNGKKDHDDDNDGKKDHKDDDDDWDGKDDDWDD